MRKIIYYFLIGSITLFYSCSKSLPSDQNKDCNNIPNGTAMIDSCGLCQKAYIYDVVTHAVTMIDDTTNVELDSTQMLVMPDNPMNSYWNSSCAESWDCVNGGCIDPGTGNGQYATQAACEAVCSPIIDDCNGVPNGPAMIDSCGVCQKAYIYDVVTHTVTMIDDTNNIQLGPTQMIVMPNNPMNAYWNSSCAESWDCVNGGCIDPGTGNGQYATQAACEAVCSPTTNIITVTELNASNYTVDPANGTLSGDFVKFNFSSESVVTGDNWDIAFRGTTIIINGGEASNTDQPNRTASAAVYIANGTMSTVTEVDVASLLQDNSTSPAIPDDFGFTGMGWCTYDMNTHVISPIAGKILVFRTHDNKYAKMEILSFYDNPMTSPYGGFYTFNYVLTGGATTF